MLDPGVFLLDEPTANLAPPVAAELLDEHVRELASGGIHRVLPRRGP